MTRFHATRDLILTYLRVAGEPRPVLVIRKYMAKMHKVGPGATRTQLWRLTRAGLVRRTQPGYYEWAANE